jgi:hypothetical protein
METLDSGFEIFQIMKNEGWKAQDINDLLYKMKVCGDRHEHLERKEQHSRVFGNKPTILLTISFDKNVAQDEIVSEMEKFIRLFKESNYKWCENAIYSFEFFSKEGWNPHIHLVSEKNDAPSIITKAVKRSPAFKKTNTYNVNLRVGNDKYHYDYIKGNKKEEKLENCDLDTQFRESRNLLSHYSL